MKDDLFRIINILNQRPNEIIIAIGFSESLLRELLARAKFVNQSTMTFYGIPYGKSSFLPDDSFILEFKDRYEIYYPNSTSARIPKTNLIDMPVKL